MAYEVDEVDLQIISRLQLNLLETNKAVASAVGMSDVGVASRIRRLIENNMIRPTLFYDAESEGLPIYGIFEVNVKERCANEVAEDLAVYADFQVVARTIGASGITLMFFAQNNAHVDELRGKVSGVKGVDTIDTLISARLIKFTTVYGAYGMLRGKRADG